MLDTTPWAKGAGGGHAGGQGDHESGPEGGGEYEGDLHGADCIELF